MENNSPSGKSTSLTYNITESVEANSTLAVNVGTEFISTNEDKIRIVLTEHIQNVENRKNWHTPLGIFVSLIGIPFTTEFKAIGPVSAEQAQAICIFIIFLIFIWLVISVISFFKSRKSSIDTIINKIKRPTERNQQER